MSKVIKLIQGLKDSGLSEQQISDAVSDQFSVTCSQATINRIYKGNIENPGYKLVDAMTDLFAKRCNNTA